MRTSGSCWSCTLLLLGYSGRVWGIRPEDFESFGISMDLDHERLSPGDQPVAQKKLVTDSPLGFQSFSNTLGVAGCTQTTVCGTSACSVTSETTITILHPKITEAPLFKRKLGSNKWDIIHEEIQGRKRDATECGAGNQACPASFNGGCCPNDRVCGMDSCVAVSVPPATVCGVAGYVACGLTEGGGCCPQSYACQVGGCSPSAGVSNTETCGVSSYLCPASLGYGCCLSGFACGASACYATSISTFMFTETVTTTDAENLPHTLTSTFTATSSPTIPTDLASNTAPNGVIAKVTPTQSAIPKTSPTSSSSSNGLTKAQIGGIIGGAVVLLTALILASFCIIHRLNKVVAASTASKSRTRTSSNTRPSGRPGPSASDMDTMSIDPLMMTPSEASSSVRFPSHPSLAYGSAYEVDGSSSSPLVFGSPFSPRSPSSKHDSKGYNPVPTSDSTLSSGYGRYPSTTSTPPPGYNPHPGYFDIFPDVDLRDQNLRFGHPSPPSRITSQHQRNLSEISNVSEFSVGSSSIAELDAGRDGDRRSSLQRALQGFGMGRISMRRKSSGTNPSPITLTGSPASRHPDWASGANPGAGGLGHISEAGESRIAVHDTGGEMREVSLIEPVQVTAMASQGQENIMGHRVDFLRRSN